MEIEYLQVEDVEYLHDLAIEEYGGVSGREPGKLEAKLAIPMSGFGDYDHYPTIVEKAAACHFFLASGHCFVDGNKRTSYLATFTFLDINGYDLIADNDDVFSWTLLLANDKTRPQFEEAVHWISNRIKKQE
jgi:death on curing protein